MPKFTAETAKEMRRRAVLARQRNAALRKEAEQLARNFLCQNPRAQLGIDLGTQLRTLHHKIMDQIAIAGSNTTKGGAEYLHGLVQVERELVSLLNESGLEKNRVPDEVERLINQDPEVSRKGFTEAVQQLKQEGPIRDAM